MLGNPGTYATKKRKKPVLKHKKPGSGGEVLKSNPSKRHRDRLNSELDRLTELLPFSEDVRSRLDKLSVLRLSVGYLRVKSFFTATLNNGSGQLFQKVDALGFTEGELLLQALNGFVIVVTSEGLVFYTSQTIKDYLGFHQSDVVHQNVFDLIHTDDRNLFKQQLHFNPPPTGALFTPDQLPPENSSFLDRSFVCRFRCLLDNSSGFLALKFQGRLKYLHGQSVLRDMGTCVQPQLALFCIAVPVQPPSIVEIRAKMLLFQTKHRLDFTPMAVDSRGKVVLGYSETELCSKGSGYQFIHAADMMYCADNHIRMIKTGESGLTVFRLLTKSGAWIWVKANAKLIFKGGRPEFIIAYQKALVNAEGEEFLRQRRRQLPFSCTTGEAVLYNTRPMVDISELQFNKQLNSSEVVDKDGAPQSLLDCLLKQNQMVYTQPLDSPGLPVDNMDNHMDSHALVTIANDAWQGTGSDAVGDSVVVKEEAKTSVITMIEGLEKMAQNGDFCTALQSLEVGDAQLLEWENTLRRLSQDADQQGNVRSDLDTIITNDIFDYIDSVLFSEKEDTDPPSCLKGVDIDLEEPSLTQADPFPGVRLPELQMFQSPSSNCTYSPVNRPYAHQQGGDETGMRLSSVETAILNGSQKLSHPGVVQAKGDLPATQQLQLQDIFSLAIELPEITVLDASLIFPSCGETSDCCQTHPQPCQHLLCLQNKSHHPTAGRQLLLNSTEKSTAVPSSAPDILPPLIHCNDFDSPNAPNIPLSFSPSWPQGSIHFEPPQQWPQNQAQKPQLWPQNQAQKPQHWPQTQAQEPQQWSQNHAQKAQQWLQNQAQEPQTQAQEPQEWPQNQAQKPQQWPQKQTQKPQPWPQSHVQILPHTGMTQSLLEALPLYHNQTSQSQTFPNGDHLPRSVIRLSHCQHGGLALACAQKAQHNSCMFSQHLPSGPTGDDAIASSGPGCLGTSGTSLNHSPPQDSCYFQWDGSEPAVGLAIVHQENTDVPLTFPSGVSSSEGDLNIQQLL